MNYICEFLIFMIVFIIYLHVMFHLKTNNSTEIFELNEPFKEDFELTCDIRQPVVFTWNCFPLMNLLENKLHIDNDLINPIKTITNFLQPYFTCNTHFEVITKNTLIKHELSYRNYFILMKGDATVRLIPPKYTKMLRIEPNYLNMTFSSPTYDVWTNSNKDNVPYIEYKFEKGKTIYIPAYWNYSIKMDEENTIVTSLHYSTYMNNLSIFPHYCMYFLQMLNTTTTL